MSRKTFVLDTNVLIHDPAAFRQFPDSDVVIPLTVIEELDGFKKHRDDLGYSARQTIRLLDGLRLLDGGDLNAGVLLDNGSNVSVKLNARVDLTLAPLSEDNDAKIIMVGRAIRDQGRHVVFVSKDLAARIKALAFGLEVRDYESNKVNFESLDRGYSRAKVPKSLIDLCFKNGSLSHESVLSSAAAPWSEEISRAERAPYPNEYLLLTSGEDRLLCKFAAAKNGWEKVRLPLNSLWGLEPRGYEQTCAVDLLLDDTVPLVTILGPAGTGKTLLALACGLRKTFDENTYTKMLVSRPIVPLGKDIGYLPGTKEEKLTPWMQPIFDNLEFLCASTTGHTSDTMQWVLESRKLEMEAVTYIRGRSLPKMYIIIDEAQNLTPHEIKTLVSRAGQGSKVILTGDPTQIDNPYLDKDSNGLSYCATKLKSQALCGHIVLEKTERSDLAALAARVL